MSVLFVSHGAPSMLLEDEPAKDVLEKLAVTMPRPKAVLCLSAHWQTAELAVSDASELETLHDFFGFEQSLYRLQYPAQGAPQLAAELVSDLRGCGYQARGVHRGLDHGSWVPLMLMYPDADVPVLTMSLPANRSAHWLCQLGRSLTHLREKEILIICSGSSIHNLSALEHRGTATADWALAFQHWLVDGLQKGRLEHLLDWQGLAPSPRMAHPTTEHLDPLWVALGASAGAVPKVLYEGFSHANLGMLQLLFE